MVLQSQGVPDLGLRQESQEFFFPPACVMYKVQQIVLAIPLRVPVVRITPRVAGSTAQAFPGSVLPRG